MIPFMERQACFLAIMLSTGHESVTYVTADVFWFANESQHLFCILNRQSSSPMNGTLDRKLVINGVVFLHNLNDVLPTFVTGEGRVIANEKQGALGPGLSNAPPVHLTQKSNLPHAIFAFVV